MTRKPGSHLTYEERCHIYAYLRSGKSKRHIAKLIGCSHSTIISETSRNKGKRGYRSNQAHEFALARRVTANSKKMTPQVIDLIRQMLLENQSSPEQISGRLFRDSAIQISHETIYTFIWQDKKNGGELYKNLRHKAKKYNKRASKTAGRGLIPNRRDISERPVEVEKKERFGDFELDTIVGAGHKGAIVSIVDRSSKYVYLRLLKQGTASNVKEALCESLNLLSQNSLVHTYTADNGKEFSCHEKVVEELGGDFFFARPYHSWERGLNEHTNGLVRQYFPKGTEFTMITEDEVADVQRKLNSRPRKILNFETPDEAFLRLTKITTNGSFQP